jgi:uncharacterized Tic20 family protein
MLTFLLSLVIMFTVVGSLITWAKRKERRQMTAYDFDAMEEVPGRARHHR